MHFSLRHMLVLTLLTPVVTVAMASTGELDSSFGTGGKLLLALPAYDQIRSIQLVDNSDKAIAKQNLLIAAQCTASSVCVTRRLADGSADSSFATAGVFTSNLSDNTDKSLVAVAKSADFSVSGRPDKFVVLVNSTDSNTPWIARYNNDGTLDTETDANDVGADVVSSTKTHFGDTGLVKLTATQWRGSEARANALAVNSSNSVLVGGTTKLDGELVHRGVLMRLNASGTVDPVFYGSGVHYFDYRESGAQVDIALDQMRVDNSSRIVVVLHTLGLAQNKIILRRFFSTGAEDTGFGSAGSFVLPFSLNPDTVNAEGPATFDFTVSGEILVAASVRDGGAQLHTALALVKSDGTLDTAFNTNGMLMLQPGAHQLTQLSVAALPDDSFIVTGQDGADTVLFPLPANGDSTAVDTNIDTVAATNFLTPLKFLRGGEWLAGVNTVAGNADLLKFKGDDRTPAADFSFVRQDNVAVSATVSAAVVTISGLTNTSIVSISDGTLAVIAADATTLCSASSLSYSSSAVIHNNDKLCVRQTASSSNDTEKVSTIYIGNKAATFTSKTVVASSSGGGGGGGGAFAPWLLLLLPALRRRK